MRIRIEEKIEIPLSDISIFYVNSIGSDFIVRCDLNTDKKWSKFSSMTDYPDNYPRKLRTVINVNQNLENILSKSCNNINMYYKGSNMISAYLAAFIRPKDDMSMIYVDSTIGDINRNNIVMKFSEVQDKIAELNTKLKEYQDIIGD